MTISEDFYHGLPYFALSRYRTGYEGQARMITDSDFNR